MDYFLWAVVAVTQVLVGFLGVLAIKSDFAGQHFKTFVAAFAILSIAGLIASGWGVVRATNASNEITRLQKDTLYAIEGSPDSSLVLHGIFQGGDRVNYNAGEMEFQFYNESKYPMIDTHIWVSGRRNVKCEPDDYARNIGDVYAGNGGTLPKLKAFLNKEKENEIHFTIQARSVTLWQDYVSVWNGEAWVSDWALYKEIDGKTIYLKKFRHDFPFKGKRIHDDVELSPKQTAKEKEKPPG